MLPSEEDFVKKVKVISDESWRIETNTTVNAICEYISREVGKLFLTYIRDINIRLEFVEEELRNGKDGRGSQPEGCESTKSKGTRHTKARETNGTNEC